MNKFYCRVLHVFHFIDEGFPTRHSKTMACCVDEFHLIEEGGSSNLWSVMGMIFTL